ncbi:hypothetical protein K439DRAFT_1631538 [Ramaria rubella]|nr:hypothetical protein K439DRAFT_1631538 [Ramaria rubella]
MTSDMRTQVENTLFKIPRFMLDLNAPNLMESLSLASGRNGAGLTDDTPLRLEYVTALEFERLLSILYPIISSEEYPSAIWKTEEWASILYLATKYEMKSIRSMALKKLNNVASPASKIALGRKYNQPMWIQEGLLTLCLREEGLNEEEARELEMKDVVGCASAREAIRAKVMTLESGTIIFSSPRLGSTRVRLGKYEDGMKYMNNAAVRDIVETTFGILTETVPEK